jgi:flagellar biosynthesis chaperone FliJ
MPLLFGILTALVLTISAWIGFKNQSEYKKQIGFRQTEETNLKREVKFLKKRTAELSATKAAIEEIKAANEVLAEEITARETQIESIKSEIAQKKSKIARFQIEVDEATVVMNKVGGVRTLVPKINGLRSDIASLDTEIAQGNTTLSNLKQSMSDTQESIAENEERVELETTGKSQRSLKTTIKTIYTSWGFVTLNGGDIQGVVPGSTLAVVRDNEVVAKLKVTTVEPNRAAADILRDSLGADVFLRAGDEVVAIASVKPAVPAEKVTAN